MKRKFAVTIICEAEAESEDVLDDLSYELGREMSNALDEMSNILNRDEVKEFYSEGVTIASGEETNTEEHQGN